MTDMNTTNTKSKRRLIWLAAIVGICALLAIFFWWPASAKMSLTTSASGLSQQDGDVALRLRAIDALQPTEELYNIDVTGRITNGQLSVSWDIPASAQKRATYVEICADQTTASANNGGELCVRANQPNTTYSHVSCPYYVSANSIGIIADFAGWNKLNDGQRVGCASDTFGTTSVVSKLLIMQQGIQVSGGGVLMSEDGKVVTKDLSSLVKEILATQTPATVQNNTSPVTYLTTNIPVAGPQGAAGATGMTGANGNDGTNGVNGTNGVDGIDGNDGAVGATGPTGATGPQGPQGDPGVVSVSGGGLVLTGANLSLAPCAVGQLLKSDGTNYVCANDIDTDTVLTEAQVDAYASNNGYLTTEVDGSISNELQTLSLLSNQLAISSGNSVDLSAYLDNTDNQALSWSAGTRTLTLVDGGSVVISDADTTYTAGTGLTLGGTTFALNDTGVVPGAYNFVTVDAQGRVTNASNVAYLTSETDGVIGNELTDVTSGSGMVRTGSGTAADPYRVSLITTCASGQLLKWNGTAWSCAADIDTDTNTDQQTIAWNAGTNTLSIAGGNTADLSSLLDNTDAQAISLTGNTIAITGSASTIDLTPYLDNTDAQTLATTGTGNSRTLTISGGNSIALTDNDTLRDLSCTTNQLAKWNGSAWSCANDIDTVLTEAQVDAYTANNGYLTSEVDGSVTNELQSLSLSANQLAISSGNSVDLSAYLDNTDNQALSISGNVISLTGGGSITLPADQNTTYTSGNGLTLSGTTFAVNAPTCSGTDKLQWNGTAFVCVTDVDNDSGGTVTSVAAGTGLTGGTITNSGTISIANTGVSAGTYGSSASVPVLTVNAQGQITGATTQSIAFPPEQDAIIGNEVVGGTGTNSGLTRSGSGTVVDPYTLAVNVGNGLQVSGNQIAVIAPTCAGTTKLQWNGTAFVCAVDIDTNTDQQTLSTSTTTPDVNNTTTTTVSISNGNSINFVDRNTIYSAGTGIAVSGSNQISNMGVISFTTGSSTAVVNSGTATNPVVDLKPCANGEVLRYNTTSGQWECVNLATATAYAFTVSDGTNSQPINNTDTINFIGAGGLSATVSATDQVTYQINNSGVTSIKIADGTITTADIGAGQIVGGAGGVIADNTIDANDIAAGGVDTSEIASNAVTNSKLATDAVTTNKILDGTILFADLSANSCTTGQIIGFNGTAWTCAADNNTTYSAGTGISFSGTTINNTGVLSATGTGAVTNTGTAQNPVFNLTNTGVTAGTYNTVTVDAQGRITNGSNIAYLTAEQDGVIGNEVTDVVSGSGLVRTGTGTSADPYKVGLLTTCTAGQLLKWSGTAWACTADVDTNTDAVSSVFGRTGAVTAQNGDYTASQVTNTPAGNIAATTVQTAINELDIEKLGVTLNNGQIWVGNGSNVATAVTPSGDVLISNTGVTTIQPNSVALGTDTTGNYVAGATSGSGITVSGTAGEGWSPTVSINAPTCAGTTKLQWNGTAFICAADVDTNSGGTVTSVATGTGLSGGPITSTGTISIADTGVTAGIYGSATTIPVITVNAQGQITTATTASIPTASTGTTGLLTSTDWNTFNDKENVLTFNGNGLFSRAGDTVTGATCPAIGDILKWNGTTFACAADNNTAYTSDNGITMTGSNFQLGGTLLHDTTIAQNGFGVEFLGGDFLTQRENAAGNFVTMENSDNLLGAGASGFIMSITPDATYTGGEITYNYITEGAVVSGVVDATGNQATNQLSPTSVLSGTYSATGAIAQLSLGSGSATLTAGDGSGISSVSFNPTSIDFSTPQINFNSYPSTRNDTATYTPVNFLYTNASGKVFSAPVGAITGAPLVVTDSATIDFTTSGTGNHTVTGIVIDGSISTAKLANGSVDTNKIVDGTIASVDLANNAVTGAKILDGTVLTADIGDGTIAFADIASNSCTANQIFKWNGTAWSCGADATGADAQQLAYDSSTRTLSLTNSTSAVFPLAATTTTGLALCDGATGNVICQNGNSFGSAVTIGSKDAQQLSLITSGASRFVVDSVSAGLTGQGVTTIDSSATNALNIGTGANAKIITIGNVTGATTTNINAGTGGVNVSTAGTNKLTINSTGELLLPTVAASRKPVIMRQVTGQASSPTCGIATGISSTSFAAASIAGANMTGGASQIITFIGGAVTTGQNVQICSTGANWTVTADVLGATNEGTWTINMIFYRSEISSRPATAGTNLNAYVGTQ